MTLRERWLWGGAVVMILGVVAASLRDPRQGLHEMFRRRGERDRLVEEIGRLRERRDALEREVVGLRENPRVIEKRARRDLGMIRKGETVFLLPERDGAKR